MQWSEMRLVLTGASGGLGQAIACALAAQGCSLLLVGRSGLKLQQLLARLPKAQGQRHLIVEADIRLPEQREILAQQAETAGVNGLINLAGSNQFVLFEQQTDEAIADMLQTNLIAAMQLTRRLLPRLRQQPEGLVVNVGSILGSIGFPGYATYCASKFALRGFSETLARELADSTLRVLYFAPRAAQTSLNSDAAMAMNLHLGSTIDSAETVARALVSAIGGLQPQTFLGWPEKLFVRLNAIAPGLVSRSMAKQLPIIKRYL
ncbi:SDR family oxidoreductase [Pontibacter sp. JAM-7]|uniref:SDR family oxidoreductase n=1 Tax=Pontibacter sp. JAM-7 TaxID=3366581 RepID=UPI003AF88B05